MNLIIKKMILFILPVFLIVMNSCFPDRTVTDPDYEVAESRRPSVVHSFPMPGKVNVARNAEIKVWFDELMDESSFAANFYVRPAIDISSISALEIDPNKSDRIYAIQPLGLFLSEDGAEVWEWLSPGLITFNTMDLKIANTNSDVIFAATSDTGVYKSTDAGVSWQQFSSGLPEMNILTIEVDPSDENIVYAVTSLFGIYKSVDGGVTWTEKNEGYNISRGKPMDIAINPLNTNVLYAPTGGNYVLKTIDGGENWTSLISGFLTRSFLKVAIHPQDTSLVFAVANNGFYKSHNSGANWQFSIDGLTTLSINDVVVHPQDTNRVLLSTSQGLFRSWDAGNSWNEAGTIADGAILSMMKADPQNLDRIFAAANSGVYLSDDFGTTWIEKNNLPSETLYVGGIMSFETWKDSTTIITPIDSVTIDTTVIHPYVYERALEGWDVTGDPPTETDPKATLVIFEPVQPLLPNFSYMIRIEGAFLSDKETLRDDDGGVRDITGNSKETRSTITFTTGNE